MQLTFSSILKLRFLDRNLMIYSVFSLIGVRGCLQNLYEILYIEKVEILFPTNAFFSDGYGALYLTESVGLSDGPSVGRSKKSK